MLISKLRFALGKITKQFNVTDSINQKSQKKFKRCVLHIGTEKTGTSSIQRFLTKNRQLFLQDGVLYPSITGEDGGSQWDFVVCAHNEPWKTDVGKFLGIESEDDQDIYREDLRKKLALEFSANPDADVLIISSEHMHSRLTNKKNIAQLKCFLEEWVEKFEVVMYIRRQDRVAVSHYSTKIKSGNTDLFVFPRPIKGDVPYYFNYELIYDNWSTVFGSQSIQVRLFSSEEWIQGNLVQDFCGACAISSEGKQIPEAENESLNSKGVDFLREINRQLPGSIVGEQNEDRDKLTQIISKLCRGKNIPASRDEAIKFYKPFQESNERLRIKVFPQRKKTLFSEDFSDYPEKIELSKPRYEDAVELAIRIWKAEH